MPRIPKYFDPPLGEKFGRWTVISRDYKRKSGGTYWKVQCECGTVEWRVAWYLVNNKSKSKSCKSCSKCPLYKNLIPLGYYKKLKKDAKNKRNLIFSLSLEEIYNLYHKQNKKCNLSGVDIGFSNSWKSLSNQTASLDRIDNSKGYTIDNVQWVHKDVNFMKGSLKQDYFISLCNKINNKWKNSN